MKTSIFLSPYVLKYLKIQWLSAKGSWRENLIFSDAWAMIPAYFDSVASICKYSWEKNWLFSLQNTRNLWQLK